jgi:hypothetical protein
VIEHTRDVSQSLRCLHALTAPGGRVWVTAANARSLGPHPGAQLWCAGWIPARLRANLLKRLRGVDSLRFVHLLTPGQVRRLARAASFALVRARPRPIPAATPGLGALERIFVAVYLICTRTLGIRHLLLAVGPSFEMVLERPAQRPQIITRGVIYRECTSHRSGWFWRNRSNTRASARLVAALHAQRGL